MKNSRLNSVVAGVLCSSALIACSTSSNSMTGEKVLVEMNNSLVSVRIEDIDSVELFRPRVLGGLGFDGVSRRGAYKMLSGSDASQYLRVLAGADFEYSHFGEVSLLYVVVFKKLDATEVRVIIPASFYEERVLFIGGHAFRLEEHEADHLLELIARELK